MTFGLWAPVVFARTGQVDFRLLARPKGLRPHDLDWLQAHIAGAAACADDLREGPRFSLFKNERLCVFGVSCMAGELSGDNIVVGGRDLYLFAGFATLVDTSNFPTPPHHAAVPSLAKIDVRPYLLFRPLYEHVHRWWHDDRTVLTPEEVARDWEHSYQPHADIRRLTFQAGTGAWLRKLMLSYDATEVRLHAPSNARTLWGEASRSRRPVSLCCGLPDPAAVQDGPFLNAAIRTLADEAATTAVSELAAVDESPAAETLVAAAPVLEENSAEAASTIALPKPTTSTEEPAAEPTLLTRMAQTVGGLFQRGSATPTTATPATDGADESRATSEPVSESDRTPQLTADEAERLKGYKKLRDHDDPAASQAVDHWIDYGSSSR